MEFRLFGQRWECLFIDKLEEHEEALGRCIPQRHRIELDKKLKQPKNKDTLHWTLLHELLHAVFWVTQHNDLYKDETFIDTVSGLMHQALSDLDRLK